MFFWCDFLPGVYEQNLFNAFGPWMGSMLASLGKAYSAILEKDFFSPGEKNCGTDRFHVSKLPPQCSPKLPTPPE